MSNYMYITRELPSRSTIQYHDISNTLTSAREDAVMDGSPWALHHISCIRLHN